MFWLGSSMQDIDFVKNQSYDFLLDELNIGLIILDRRGCVIKWNAWFEKYSGIPLNGFRGKTLENIFPELQHTRLINVISQCLQTGISSMLSTKLNKSAFPLYTRQLNGDLIDQIEQVINVKPLLKSHECQGCLIQIFDVTSASIREKAMRKQAERLKQSNSDLEQFAYIASHDLQEPLRTIHGFGNLLITEYESHLPAEGQNFLKRIVRGSERLRVMISDLLSFSRLSNGSMSLKPIELGLFIDKILGQADAEIKNVEATVEVGDLPVVYADEKQLEHLLQNILQNALKFKKTDIPLVVKIYQNTMEEHTEKIELNKFARICIEDNGIGFQQAHSEKIFNAFERLHSKSKYPGTGLGLAICRKIIERHNGHIAAFGEPGIGAKFNFTLPTCKSSLNS